MPCLPRSPQHQPRIELLFPVTHWRGEGEEASTSTAEETSSVARKHGYAGAHAQARISSRSWWVRGDRRENKPTPKVALPTTARTSQPTTRARYDCPTARVSTPSGWRKEVGVYDRGLTWPGVPNSIPTRAMSILTGHRRPPLATPKSLSIISRHLDYFCSAVTSVWR